MRNSYLLLPILLAFGACRSGDSDPQAGRTCEEICTFTEDLCDGEAEIDASCVSECEADSAAQAKASECIDDEPGTCSAYFNCLLGTVEPDEPMTIYDVQDPQTPPGTSVSLENVIVTAIDTFGGSQRNLYVQEADGGPFSGVTLRVSTLPAGIAVGDIVNVSGGVKEEFSGIPNSFEFPDGYSVTQVNDPQGGAMTIEKVGTGELPEPELLNVADLASDAEAEKWVGVLIKIVGVRALEETDSVSNSDSTLLEIKVEGPFRIGGSLAQLKEDGAIDDCYGSVTGIGDYFFNYKILPRSQEDIVFDAEAAACVLVDHTVVETQDGTVAENTRVRLPDVLVTAVSADNKKFWVQDRGGAAAFNGLFVFRPNGAEVLPESVVPGARVTLIGNVVEFDTLTELTNVNIAEVIDAELEPVGILEGVSLADLSTDKQYEGVVALVENVDVVASTSCNQDNEFCNYQIQVGNGDPVFANDTISAAEATAGQCFSTFVGIMHYDGFDNRDRIVILPLTDGLGASCAN